MKYLIITVAGTATRFNRDTEKETLKCLYYKDSPKFALLNQLIKNCGEYNTTSTSSWAATSIPLSKNT